MGRFFESYLFNIFSLRYKIRRGELACSCKPGSTLHVNSTCFYLSSSVELMSEVVNSQELFVMQIEVDVYNLLKVWAYLHLHPNWEGSWKDVRAQSNTYFASRATDSSLCFLETDEGRKFVPAFRAIRLHHVVNDIRSIQLLDTDRIIPQGTQPVFATQSLSY